MKDNLLMRRERLYCEEISKVKEETDKLIDLIKSTVRIRYPHKPHENFVLTDQYTEFFKNIWGKDIEPEENDMTTSIWKGLSGAVVDPHSHVEVEMIFIIKGEIEVSLPGRKVKLTDQESLKIDKNTLHQIYFVKDSRLIVQWKPKAV